MPAAKPAGDKYFELTQEVKVPEPIKVPLGGSKSAIIKAPTRAQVKAMTAAETVEDADRAILGDAYDSVDAYYNTRPHQEWNDFITKLNKHFFGPGADDVEGKSQDSSD